MTREKNSHLSWNICMEELLYAVLANLTTLFFWPLRWQLKLDSFGGIICFVLVMYSIRLQSNFALNNRICV